MSSPLESNNTMHSKVIFHENTHGNKNTDSCEVYSCLFIFLLFISYSLNNNNFAVKFAYVGSL